MGAHVVNWQICRSQNMFDDLYDAISMLWSWRWPTSEGEVTAVDIERVRHSRGGDTLRWAIAYKFSLGDDGPQSFWEPSFFAKKKSVRSPT